MGREYGLGLTIKDYELYQRIHKASFNVYHNGKVIDKYIDYAYFFGMKEIKYGEEDATKLTNEEMDKLNGLTKFKRVRCGYIHIGRWNKKTKQAWVCFRGWNGVPYGVVEYISKLNPEIEYEIQEAWDDEEFDSSPHSYKYFLKNGIMTRKIWEVWNGYNEKGNGVWKKIDATFDGNGNVVSSKSTFREVEPSRW